MLSCWQIARETELLSCANFTAELTFCVFNKLNCGLQQCAGCEFPYHAVFCNVLSLAVCVALSAADQVSHPQNNVTVSLSGEVSELASCVCFCFCHTVDNAHSR